jgi:hypothetical protein
MIQEHSSGDGIAKNIFPFLEHGSLNRYLIKKFASRKYYGISVLEKLKTNGLLETKFQVLTIHQIF